MQMRIRRAFFRARRKLRELTLLLVGLTVIGFVCFEVDVFESEGQISLREETVELDEALLLGGLLAVALLVYSIRRFNEQQREAARRLAAEKQIRAIAYQDALTGLPNRRRFDDALKTAMGSLPGAGSVHAVFLMDLNGFKQINDLHGHGTGDDVLISVSQRLQTAMRGDDLVARFGGDEFAILARALSGAEAATSIALRVMQSLEKPIRVGDNDHLIGVGIGIALIPADAASASEALRKADVALYRAKTQHRSAFRYFEESMDRHIQERERLERDLRSAIASNQFDVVYQPTFDLKSSQVVAFAAKPRWRHPHMGEIPPERFVPIAEETGLMHELAEGWLREACAAAALWPVNINLEFQIFPSQLKDPDLKRKILESINVAQFAPHRLELGITEDAVVRNMEEAQAVLGGLRAAGVRISLDNFGTGYSNLYHLRSFKVDKIKIDRRFIESMADDEESSVVVSALVGLGHGLGLVVAADGIEDTRQHSSLLFSGCEQGQRHTGAVSAAGTLAFFAQGATGQSAA